MSSNFETPSHPLPKPVSAYVGLLLAAVEDTREPGASIVARIARMPIATFGQLLTARQRYDELAHHGDDLVETVVNLLRAQLGREFVAEIFRLEYLAQLHLAVLVHEGRGAALEPRDRLLARLDLP